MKRPLLVLPILLSAALFSVGHAQPSADSIRVHFPIVTSIGTRFAEPWIQVPLSITIIPMKDLAQGKGYGMDEVLSGIPGVFAQSRYGNQDVRLIIRGYGARGAGERSNAGTTRGIRILNNGFPETEPDGRTSFDLVDLSGAGGIEVIRSNASSLYGNASGGVVSVGANTGFDSPYGAFAERVGDFGFHKEAVNAGAFLGSGRFYLSFSNTNAEGWRWHSRSSQALLSTGVVTPIGQQTDLGIHLAATSNIFRVPGPLSQAQYAADPQQADSLYIKRDERRYNRLGRLGVSVSHQIDEWNFVSASTFIQPKIIQRSERGTFRDFTRYHFGGNALYRNSSEPGSNVRNILMLGVDEAYQDGAILFYNLTAASQRGTLRDNKREGANNFGMFVQDEVEAGTEWGFLLGLRYDNITYYSQSFVTLRLDDQKSFTQITPKFGVTYRLSPTHSLYANVGGGIEAPAGNETDPAPTEGQDTIYAINPLLEPIRSTAFEIGTKQILSFGQGSARLSLSYDIAAYWLRVTNDIIPYRNGRFYFTAGLTERMGCEVSARAEHASGVSANVAVTVSRNIYREYVVDSVHYSPSLAGRTADYGGNSVVGIPDLFLTVGARFQPGFLGGGYVRIDLQQAGRYYVNDANTIEVPAYTVVNAGAGIERWTFGAGPYYIGGFVGINNLMDLRYIGSAWLNPDVVNGVPVYIESALPRNVVIALWMGVTL
jgi:iron complex outermembrane recepter protein